MELTIKEIKPILKHIIENNKKLESEGKMPIACELIGAAGIAKTAIIEEVAKEYDANYVKISLSQISEIGEISGYPIREHYVCKPDGDCRWITPELIDIYAKSGYEITDLTRMSYSVPKWIQELDINKIYKTLPFSSNIFSYPTIISLVPTFLQYSSSSSLRSSSALPFVQKILSTAVNIIMNIIALMERNTV